jgi:2-keto-4-pentenoate hydratase/2-oxohepta-3-ene-1,7-dioic acid hydratase in catechol pathway
MELNFNFTDKRTEQIGTMYCIGRNYAQHAKELGNAIPDEPIVFLKPPSAYLANGAVFTIPTFSKSVHHEVELVVVLGSDCYKITPEEAKDCIAGVGIGLDLTLRDVQTKAKEKGLPWAVAKGFAGSAPISEIVPINQVNQKINNLEIELYINGELRQKGNTNEMERTVEELISYLSTIFVLRKNDLIFTGTPSGVGEIKSNDKLKANLVGYTSLNISVL